MEFTLAHIDADSFLYKAGFSVERNGELVPDAETRLYFNMRDLLLNLRNNLPKNIYMLYFYLGKRGGYNFRSDVAVAKPYKKKWNSKIKAYESRVRPVLFEAAYDMFEDILKYNITIPVGSLLHIVDNVEAEDVIADRYNTDSDVIVHIDKDLNQLPGHHINYDTFKYYFIEDQEAYYNLWKQIVLGDPVDNIPGLKHYCSVKGNNGKPKGFGKSGFAKTFEEVETIEDDVKEWVFTNIKDEYKDKLSDEWYNDVLQEQSRLVRLGGVNEQANIVVTSLQ